MSSHGKLTIEQSSRTGMDEFRQIDIDSVLNSDLSFNSLSVSSKSSLDLELQHELEALENSLTSGKIATIDTEGPRSLKGPNSLPSSPTGLTYSCNNKADRWIFEIPFSSNVLSPSANKQSDRRKNDSGTSNPSLGSLISYSCSTVSMSTTSRGVSETLIKAVCSNTDSIFSNFHLAYQHLIQEEVKLSSLGEELFNSSCYDEARELFERRTHLLERMETILSPDIREKRAQSAVQVLFTALSKSGEALYSEALRNSPFTIKHFFKNGTALITVVEQTESASTNFVVVASIENMRNFVQNNPNHFKGSSALVKFGRIVQAMVTQFTSDMGIYEPCSSKAPSWSISEVQEMCSSDSLAPLIKRMIQLSPFLP